jgi:hypothetical protein
MGSVTAMRVCVEVSVNKLFRHQSPRGSRRASQCVPVEQKIGCRRSTRSLCAGLQRRCGLIAQRPLRCSTRLRKAASPSAGCRNPTSGRGTPLWARSLPWRSLAAKSSVPSPAGARSERLHRGADDDHRVGTQGGCRQLRPFGSSRSSAAFGPWQLPLHKHYAHRSFAGGDQLSMPRYDVVVFRFDH